MRISLMWRVRLQMLPLMLEHSDSSLRVAVPAEKSASAMRFLTCVHGWEQGGMMWDGLRPWPPNVASLWGRLLKMRGSYSE